MTAKLIRIMGALTGCALLVPAAQAARGDVALKTMGNTQILPSTARCPGGVERVLVGVQVGTQMVLAGPEVVPIPVVVRRGTATFCVQTRMSRSRGGDRTATASGRLTLELAAGTIEAAATETQSSAGGKTRYSSLATIKSGTGMYRGVSGAVIARGTVGPAPERQQCRKLTYTFEFA